VKKKCLINWTIWLKRTPVSKTSPLKKMIDFIEINDVDLSAIMIKDEHTGFIIFTGDKIFVWSRRVR